MTLPKLLPEHIAHALAVITRLPGGKQGPLHEAAWSFAVIGIIIGALQSLAAILALWFGVPAVIAALLALIVGMIATGALHEDGLADMADGCGAWDRARRLEIMRDSMIGSYGTLALITATGLRWSALALLFSHGFVVTPLVIAGVTSRAAMGLVMAALPPARSDGMGHSAGRPDPMIALVGIAIAALITILMYAGAFVPVVLCVGLSGAAVAWFAQTRLGGQTGDVLGASQQITEIAALVALAAMI